MFNFFDEIKKKGNGELFKGFNIVNISGKMLYVEGHLGLMVINNNEICFKVKSGRILVE